MSRPTTVLYMGGDVRERSLMRAAIEPLAFTVLSVDDAGEGMGAARLYHPGAIFLDADLPDIDPFEATRLLRSDRHLAHIPIYVLLDSDEPEVMKAFRSCGADDFVVKVSDDDVFGQALRGLVQRQDADVTWRRTHG